MELLAQGTRDRRPPSGIMLLEVEDRQTRDRETRSLIKAMKELKSGSAPMEMAARLLIFALAAFLFPVSASPETADSAPVLGEIQALEEISDRRYLPKLLELIRGAERSVEASLYQILLPGSEEETHPVYLILKALADAKARGVRVRVLLNRHLDYVSGETVPLARSLAAYEYLKAKGIEVNFAHTARRLHDKAVVIDERWVIEGSMNWTRTALESNWESATLIDSPVYASEKLARIQAIPLSEEKTLDTLGDEGELLEIPALLVTEKKYFSDLLRRKDERIFELYLWLLGEREKSGKEKFVLEDETLFHRFRLDPAKSQKDKRREARRLLKKLKKRGLIELDFSRPGSAAQVTLRALGQGSVRKLKLPFRYFEYGYSEKLPLSAEFVYLMARLEMTESPSAPWWWRSQDYLTRVYHLHHTTLATGTLELVRENLLEVVRDDAPEGRPHSERLVNRYRVNAIVSPLRREEQFKRLREKFGEERFNRAREFADRIDEPNDPVVIATILRWMDIYPETNLHRAFEQVSRYERNNPRRSLYYLRGILEGMRRD